MDREGARRSVGNATAGRRQGQGAAIEIEGQRPSPVWSFDQGAIPCAAQDVDP
jgi:hypothetical protein